MRVFLTGGTGYLGRRLLPGLVAAGHEVRALARSEEKARQVARAGAEPILGSFASMDAWKHEVKGCDAVLHAGSRLGAWGPWSGFYWEVTQATADLYNAARFCHVPRFVHVSTEAALMDRAPLVNASSATPYPKQPCSNYGRAKMLAEKALLAEPDGGPARILLRFPLIWDEESPLMASLCQKAASGRFFWLDHGRAVMEACRRENAVGALLLALEQGPDGTCCFVADREPTTVREFLSARAGELGVALPSRNLSAGFARQLADGLETIWGGLNLRQAPPLTRLAWAFAGLPRTFDRSEAQQALGYEAME